MFDIHPWPVDRRAENAVEKDVDDVFGILRPDREIAEDHVVVEGRGEHPDRLVRIDSRAELAPICGALHHPGGIAEPGVPEVRTEFGKIGVPVAGQDAAKQGATVGIGAGQMSRVDSSRIAAWKAAEAAKAAGLSESLAKGAVVASDAFFPFADGLLAAAEAGATAVIQPGGSMRDEEVIRAADEAGLAMVLTGHRHFRH